MAARVKDAGPVAEPGDLGRTVHAVEKAYQTARAAPRCDWAMLDDRFWQFRADLNAARAPADANANSPADQASQVARLRIARAALEFFDGQKDGVALSLADRLALQPVPTAVQVARLGGDWDRLRQLGDVA